MGMPVIAAALVEYYGYTEEQVGRIAGADMGSMAVGSFLISLLVNRVNRRWLAVAGIALLTGANLLCLKYTDYESLYFLRVAAGAGAGMLAAVGMAGLAGNSNTARTFTIYLFILVLIQVLELAYMPALSASEIFTVFAWCCAPLILLVPLLPRGPADPVLLAVQQGQIANAGDGAAASVVGMDYEHVPSWLGWVCLVAIVATYSNIGAFWTYIELAATASGLNDEFIADSLVYGTAFSFIGAAIATVLAKRFGQSRSLLSALVLMVGTVSLLLLGISTVTFMVAVYGYMLLWFLIDVYQLGTISNMDKSGRFASMTPMAQGLGQILGPNIAASILGAQLGYSGVMLLCAGCSLLAMLVYGAIHRYLAVHNRALAVAA